MAESVKYNKITYAITGNMAEAVEVAKGHKDRQIGTSTAQALKIISKAMLHPTEWVYWGFGINSTMETHRLGYQIRELIQKLGFVGFTYTRDSIRYSPYGLAKLEFVILEGRE